MVVEDTAPIRRKAAGALGRIGKFEAVKPLLASLRKGAGDAFLEHSLIYALIRTGAFDATLPALNDANPNVRRAALIALDQMNGTEQPVAQPSGRGHALLNPHRGDTFRYAANAALTREHIAPLLGADDPALQLAVLEVISRRPAWARELVAISAKWVRKPELDPAQREALVAALLGAADDGGVQRFIAETLVGASAPAGTRKELLGVLARSRVQPQPQVWLDALERILRGSDPAMQREALNIVRIRGLTQFDKLLAELAANSTTAADVRLTATAILAPRATMDAAAFDRLNAQLTAAGDPMLPVAAATALGSARLSTAQRQTLIAKVAEAGPLTLPLLVPAFYRTSDRPTALALAKALVASPGARALPADELEQIYGDHLLRDAEIAAVARPLIEQHKQTHTQQAQYLAELGEKMSAVAADPRRGEEVFFSKEALCSVCHVVNGRGGNLGPDLSRIGSIRTTRALLEAIVFPSSSIVPDFRAYNITLKHGAPAYGAIARETDDTIFLRTTTLEETRIARADIAGIAPSEISFMPQGLEKTMTPRQLNDLLEYLYSLR
jgi:putative heme-binding domain-containing protein